MKKFIFTLLLFSSALLYGNSQKPNILFISIDDLNDWTGFLGGHPQTKTPHLDKLAAKSAVFKNAYCQTALCGPSRASVMTGIYPFNSGVLKNTDDWRENEILKNKLTIPQYFKSMGYTTFGSGKIFHGIHSHPESWDDYYPSLDKQKPDDKAPWPAKNKRAGKASNKHFNWGPIASGEEKMSDNKVVNYVSSQLQKEHDKPFFLACGIFRPHLPWFAPQKYFDMHPLEHIQLPKHLKNDLEDIPKAGKNIAINNDDHQRVVKNGKWKDAVQAYLASVSYADDCIGRVINALNKSQYKDNTLIILWSDHGWSLGEKNHWRKHSLWEDGTKSVLLFSGINIPAGSCAQAVGLIDIYPTLIELAGLPEKRDLDGHSLAALISDPKSKWHNQAISTWPNGHYAIRTERWRYILYKDQSEELYDHNKDPHEWLNLAKSPEFTQIKDNLRSQLKSYIP